MRNGVIPVDLISVIVPVYKVEEYLDRCVQSIVDQTYQNLEIILVDDGSPDHCPAMCDAWAAKDNRIKVIHKKNGGQADARNVGMAVATGKYIAFVDSDDWIEPQMYQSMHEAMTTTGSDIVSCGAKRVWLDGTPSQEVLSVNRNCVLEQEAAMEAMITGNGLVQIPCNKLYKRCLLSDILFPVGVAHEDDFWTWQVVFRANRVSILKESYYYYLQRENSTMGVGFSEKRLVVVRAKTERQKYIERTIPKLTDVGRADLVYTCMHLGIQVLKNMCRKDTARYMKYLKDTIKNYPISKAYLRTLTWKKRLHLIILQFFFVPACWVHSIR